MEIREIPVATGENVLSLLSVLQINMFNFFLQLRWTQLLRAIGAL